MQYIIQKTNAGTRIIPITDDVVDRFRAIIDNRKLLRNETGIKDSNGKVYKDFLYNDKNGMPT